MKIKIRSKLILAISLLMVVVFSFVAYLFINEKKQEMADDIYLNVLAFAKLTSPAVADDYELYLEQSGFVYYNREIQSMFEQNDDISAIKLVSYTGGLLYDSTVDVDRKYEGELRSIDEGLLNQVQSENISLKTLDGRVLYVQFNESGDEVYVDQYEKIVDSLEAGALIDFFVIPANEKYSVVFAIDYHNLNERVAVMMRRIIYLAIFGVLLGMMLSFFMSGQITRPVAKLVSGVRKIAKGDFGTRVHIKTRDEISFLGDAFNGMAKDLEESMEAKLYKERVTRELELAAQIQDQIIPDEDEIPKVKGLDIAAGLIPAEEIGGDMYDFLPLSKDKLLMYLGDVTGHGVPAGIVSAISSALFYGYQNFADLKKIIVNVNKVLKVKTMSNMFMTLCLIEWDALKQKFSYISAGHEQLIYFSSKDKKVHLTPAGGIALGMLPDVSSHVKVEGLDLQSGDYVIVYSDGIPEAWKNEKENYGMDRFMKVVEKAGVEVNSAEEMKSAILKDVKEFTAVYKQMDDITLMVLRKD